jgi:uncharacterized damage-inducible protein DinB
MHLHKIVADVFFELEEALLQISDEEYKMPSKHLFQSSIGQHVRHIIELFQCLVTGHETGVVNYDKRRRNYTIETERMVAITLMHQVIESIDRADRKIVLEASFGSDEEVIAIESNFVRELAYNLEHTIHHMALIRVGIAELTDVKVSEKFGVAPSTIQYRKACAQ